MKRYLIGAVVLGLVLAVVPDRARANDDDRGILTTATGRYAFGVIQRGDDAVGPFLLDTHSGRMWRYERQKGRTTRLVPVEFQDPFGNVFLDPAEQVPVPRGGVKE